MVKVNNTKIEKENRKKIKKNLENIFFKIQKKIQQYNLDLQNYNNFKNYRRRLLQNIKELNNEKKRLDINEYIFNGKRYVKISIM
jgi:Skp family chaperone for outer membrane proteins